MNLYLGEQSSTMTRPVPVQAVENADLDVPSGIEAKVVRSTAAKIVWFTGQVTRVFAVFIPASNVYLLRVAIQYERP